MAFAFVFADACSSASVNIQTITIADKEVDVHTRVDADTYLRVVDSNVGINMMFNPSFMRTNMAAPYFFDWVIFNAVRSEEGLTGEARILADRRYWSVIAAAMAAEKMGLLPATDKAAKLYLEKIYADLANPEDANSERVFNAEAYAADLQKLGFDPTKREHTARFERMYNNVVYPVTLATHAIEYTTGWVSPMELDFYLSAAYDTTVARAVIVKDTRDPKTLDVTEDAVTTWYEANKQSHKHPEKRAIEYVKVPVEGFIEAATAKCNAEEGGIEVLALEYYENNRDSFKDSEGNQLQYEGDVVQQAIAKVKTQEAIKLAIESLNETVTTLNTLASNDEATVRFTEAIVTKYGVAEKAELPKTGAITVVDALRTKAFEMGYDDVTGEILTRFELCEGEDCVYVVRLTAVTPEAVKSLEDVRAIATDACQKKMLADELKVKNDSVMATIKTKMAEGKSLQEAVAEVSATTADVSLSDEVQFVLSGEAPTGDYANEMKQASAILGPKQFADSVMKSAEAVTVYVEKRYENATSALTKSTQRNALAIELSRQNDLVAQWIKANLEANMPKYGTGVDVLQTTAE